MDINKRLHEIIDGGCWHEGSCLWCGYLNFAEECENRSSHMYLYGVSLDGWCECFEWCGNRNLNPTYAHVEEIAEKMRAKGLWDEFVAHMVNECVAIYTVNEIKYETGEPNAHADILTTSEYLKQAIISWHEEGE